jgi:hypothetical protein
MTRANMSFVGLEMKKEEENHAIMKKSEKPQI